MGRLALGLGSNLGDRSAYLTQAVSALDTMAEVRVTDISALYETAPWGSVAQPDFLNQCVLLETGRTPQDMLERCLCIETNLGRVRTDRWGPRTLDMDLIAWEGPDITTETLTLPHPRAHIRAFVLIPLLQIAPNMRLHGETVRTHASRLSVQERNAVRRLQL